MLKIIVGRIPDENNFWATMHRQILDSLREFYNWCLMIMHQTIDLLCAFLNWFLATMCQVFGSLYEFLNGFLDNGVGDFPYVLGTIGGILPTILASVAIFILRSKRDFEILDRNVILGHVIDARYFFVYLALVYIPILLWDIDIVSSYPILRIIHLIFWFFGVGIAGRALFKSYRWMKGEQSKLRHEYLKKLKNPKETRESWCSVWEVGGMDIDEEKQFFTIFLSTISKFFHSNNNIFSFIIGKFFRGDNKKIKIAIGLINDFNSFIDKRSINNFKEFFPEILEWPFIDSEKKRQFIREEKDFDYQGLLLTFPDIIEKINKRALKEGRIYHVVNGFVSHIKKHKKYFSKEQQGWEYHYSDAIMSGFFDALAKNSENSKNIWIWRDFPSEWGITLENIKNKKNYVCIQLYNKFILWTRNRILSSTEHDEVLERFAYYLFPHGCPIMWSQILTFGVHVRRSGNQIKSLIERPLIFDRKDRDGPARVSGDDEEVEKKRQAEEEEMISLALFLFGDDFAQNNLDELEKMEGYYKDDDDTEFRRKGYINLLKKCLIDV